MATSARGKILAMYGCNFVSITGVMNGSRFFVPKIKWIRMADRDWGMGVSSLSNYFAPSALGFLSTLFLGRWPRLLHFAPLALQYRLFHASSNFSPYCGTWTCH